MVTAREFANDYEASSGKQWTQLLGGHWQGYEILADVLKRAQTLDKEKLLKAMAATDLETIGGHVKYKKDNTCVVPSGCLQWVKGKKFQYDAVLVSGGKYKGLPIERKTVSLHEINGK